MFITDMVDLNPALGSAFLALDRAVQEHGLEFLFSPHQFPMQRSQVKIPIPPAPVDTPRNQAADTRQEIV